MAPATIAKEELFARLAAGHAAGITVVTPNRRLARVLKADFDSFQSDRGLAVWEDADILPLDAFVGRCYEDALYAEGGSDLPLLLSPAQSRLLWEEAIRGSRWSGVLLDVPRTAEHALKAWERAHQWRISGAIEKFEGTEDTRAFADWARAYTRRLKKDALVDAALLPDIGLKVPKPRLLVAYAFDDVKPQMKDFFERFELLVCDPGKKHGRAVSASFQSPRDELESAARWARARLEAGNKRIGIVVPDLKLRRREAARVFARIMGSRLPFELSGGEPLADHPLIAFALALLDFSVREMPFEEVSKLIRSPFLAGADGEMAMRAQLDAKLRRKADADISLAKLIGLIEGCPVLRQRLEKIFALKAEKQSARDWAQHATALLDAAGFPGDRGSDSAEFQVRAKFNEVLGEFARLAVVSGKMSAAEALGTLRRLCAATEFQPEGAGAPVQLLGLLESAGMEFDALWVSGLTDDQWPQRAHPDPFLPVALQRKAGIPEASAEASLALDARRTEGWLGAAGEVVLSWARREADRELAPSPLIAQVPEGTVELPPMASFRDLLFSSRALESFEDEKANPVTSKAVKGGTRVLADQAACPFRAFARHRLGAEALEAPEPGLDAMQRGQLLHALMAELWNQLGSSSALSDDLNPAIEKAATKATKEIEGRFGELEKQRLIRLAREWLVLERDRKEFSVVAVERKVDISIGTLSFSGRIDRMDRLEDGSHAIIDYKTGSRVTSSDWAGERPDDPQLPLYAVTAGEPVSALAFAKLRAGDMKFSGFSEKEKQIPGVKQAKSWGGLVASWKGALDGLASGYAAGDARVDPKRALATCRNCDLQPLCRVHERLSALEEEEGE